MEKGCVVFLLCLIIFPSILLAQKPYWVSSGETIFSYGQVDAGAADIKAVVRFSPVFNLQQQRHFDFSNRVGLYIALGIRNVGLISHVKYDLIDSVTGNIPDKEVKIKERSYSLGLPVALKLGDLDKGLYLAIGGEAEMMFAYKRKIKDGDTKKKYWGWFDNNVNIFNPSVFFDVKFPKGQYVRFKYYLLDFLNYKGIALIDGTILPDYGKKSPLFYVSFGTLKKERSKKNNVTPTPKVTTAYFKNNRKKNFFAATSLSSSIQ